MTPQADLIRNAISKTRTKLESFSTLAWLPILIVSSLSLLVGFCNYLYQVRNQSPNLVFSNGDVGDRFLRLYWDNTGKSDAWRARATLYLVNNGRRSTKPLAESDISGAGGRVHAGFGGTSEFFLSAEVPAEFWACAYYSDGHNKFDKAVSLKLHKGQNNAPTKVDETPPPTEANCD